MKTLSLITLVAALAFSASTAPASAGHLSLVDHANVPNCIAFQVNPSNCETVDENKSIAPIGSRHPSCPDGFVWSGRGDCVAV